MIFPSAPPISLLGTGLSKNRRKLAVEALAPMLFRALTWIDAFAHVLHLTTFNYSLTKVCPELAATAGS
jgi:hypothetical protein